MERRESSYFPELTGQEVVEAMQKANGPFPAPEDSYRWFWVRGGDTVMLVSTTSGHVLKGEIWDHLPQADLIDSSAANPHEEMASMELLAREEIYNGAGDRRDLVCFRTCQGMKHGSYPMAVGSSISQDGWAKDDGRNSLQPKTSLPIGWIKNMRAWDDGTHAVYGEPNYAQNAVGLQTLWDIQLYLRDRTLADEVPKEWVEYWGNPQEDPDCRLSDQRRCWDLDIGSPLTGAGVSATGLQPFSIQWYNDGNLQATDWVAVGGWYDFWGRVGDEVPNGQTITQLIRDQTLVGLSGIPGSPDAVVAISLDVTGPILGESEDFSIWRNARYEHHYEVNQ